MPQQTPPAETETAAPPVEVVTDPKLLDPRVEAILLSVDRPITPARLAETVDADGPGNVRDAVQRLNDFYDEQERSFRIEQVAGGYQILTLPQFQPTVARLHRTRQDHKLSPAALETLAIIAYKQPILRAQIEAIRGVASGEMIRSLMDKHLVKIVGRAEELGRPMLYGTTRNFLEVFGLANLKDLPKAEELQRP
ncbi:MAG: SMC-Scp complex subunit ScpB [Phycisphaerae bacterium]|nr:SMC-Scp complex subunit ScpB [Phycisphaerae bacterium]